MSALHAGFDTVICLWLVDNIPRRTMVQSRQRRGENKLSSVLNKDSYPPIAIKSGKKTRPM